MIRVEHADMLRVIPRLVAEGVVCDAVVTDPPYNLEAMAKRFGPGQKAATSPEHQRFAKGFMGMTWDSDVAFHAETWATVATILRPGAFLVAFGGCRTYHRMTCAIEDAGFIIQDCLMFLFATGFPKNKSQMKPAYEPIVLAYKPGGKRTMQIDKCRIGTDWATDPTRRGWQGATTDSGEFGWKNGKAAGPKDAGRWPANVCHDGSDEVLAAFAVYGESKSPPIGSMGGGSNKRAIYGDFADVRHENGHGDSGTAARFFFSAKAGDLDRWTTTRHELTLSWTSGQTQCQAVLLVAMALSPPRVIAASGSTDAQEWNTFLFGNGLTDLCRKASKSTIRTTISSTTGLRTWSWLTRLLTSDCIPVATSSMANGSSRAEDAESTSLSISFTLGETASLPNADPVLSGASFRISGQEKRVGHPTVKPISLMRWLVKLVCPEGGLVLDPFAGIGTTGLAAAAENRNAILIERELTYVADIRERMAHYEGSGRHSLASKGRQARPRGETPLFDRPYDETADAIGSYNDAVRAVGAKVKSGEPVPEFFLPGTPEAAE